MTYGTKTEKMDMLVPNVCMAYGSGGWQTDC